jgi:diguanylate cyclase (GGDEF)-like protein
MPQKVLLIDDSRSIHTILAAELREEKLSILSALDGEEGIRICREQQPDLVLLDIEMPSPDGFEVCRRLKADAETSNIPIVFVTVSSTSHAKIHGLELGAVDYITKPFDPAELRARVRATLRTKHLLDLLSKKAQIDGLTGLWNRTHFHHRLAQTISLAARAGRPVACVMIDIDHFKAVNDRFGHPFGDEVLRSVASTIIGCCRREDVVCRFGGEEFVLLLPNTDAKGAAVEAERIRLAVRGQTLLHHDIGVQVTISLGVADAHPKGITRGADLDRLDATLIAAADAALYRAKRAGRDRTEIAATSNLAAA